MRNGVLKWNKGLQWCVVNASINNFKHVCVIDVELVFNYLDKSIRILLTSTGFNVLHMMTYRDSTFLIELFDETIIHDRVFTFKFSQI